MSLERASSVCGWVLQCGAQFTTKTTDCLFNYLSFLCNINYFNKTYLNNSGISFRQNIEENFARMIPKLVYILSCHESVNVRVCNYIDLVIQSYFSSTSNQFSKL